MVKSTKIKNNIRTLRFMAHEMTQAALANKINMTRQTIIAIEQGRYSPSLESAFLIAKALNANLEDVFQYEDDVDAPAQSAEKSSGR